MDNKKKGTLVYLRLLGFVKPYMGVFSLSILGMILMSATEVMLPVAIKPFLDGTFIDKDPNLIKWTPIFLVLLFLLRGVGGFLGQYAAAWVGNRIVADLRERMICRLISMPISYFHKEASGKTISRFTYDVSQVTQAATQVLTVLVKDSLTIIGLLAYLIYLDWRLTAITFIMIPPIAMVVKFFNARLRQTSHGTQAAMGELTQIIQEVIQCIKVVKIFSGEKNEKRRFSSASETIRKWVMKQTAAAVGNVPVVQLLASVATAIVVYYVTLEAQSDATTVGSFVSFLAAMLMLTAPLKRLTGVSEHLQRGIAAAESVFFILDSDIEKDNIILLPKKIAGDMRFIDVTFKYSGSDASAVKNINLAINHGETLALVGPSGGGKTTLVNLLARFYELDAGKITIDGFDISTVNLESLRKHIAFVSQDVSLFNDTVSANIAYGSNNAFDLEKVIKAADWAFAKNFILDMPNGFDTIIGERGVRLSGGQKQRIAIARALYKDASIVILDEATSALDSESESFIQEALNSLMRGKTSMVIAHRLSTIEKADRIAVLENGEIEEIGTHDNLLEKNGRYADLYRTQFRTDAISNAK